MNLCLGDSVEIIDIKGIDGLIFGFVDWIIVVGCRLCLL